MPLCKYCNTPFAWGNTGTKWVALIPEGEDANYPRTYVDTDGVFRAAHKEVCTASSGSVTVMKLAKAIMPEELPQTKPDSESWPNT